MQAGKSWLSFRNPERVIVASSPDGVIEALLEIDEATGDGLWAAGFLAYEAAAAFDLAVLPPLSGLPLLWFGLYTEAVSAEAPPFVAGSSIQAGPWARGLDAPLHADALRRLQEHIGQGDTYQVNLTFPLRTRLDADPWTCFSALFQTQRPEHAAYLDTGRFAICSVSPELFFAWDGDRIRTRPMKGTAARGRTAGEDDARALALARSEKDRAENLMIVDMLRNDLGRVAEPGSVKVSGLFSVERYPTLLQMTSTVEARTEARLPAIMAALFPCASVTGAPKVRTMEIIAQTEREPRGVYTGSLGYVGPGRRAVFNVAIRTVVFDRETGEAGYGVGSGVVADSSAAGEYAECLLKAHILSETPFRLLETLRWTPEGGFFRGEAHIDRLLASAVFFSGAVSGSELRDALRVLGARLEEASRVRLLVDLEGRIEVEVSPLDGRSPLSSLESEFTIEDLIPVAIAVVPVDEGSLWLYHKTTRREVYDRALAERPDVLDVVLWNSRGEVTESCRANVVIDLGGGFVTPPVDCGLLPGTLRAHLLECGQVREQVVKVKDLARARRLFLVSSVRGVRPARLVEVGRS
jgi:para-aminobenzoate synthetase / 4-amino-4-deoxychorismate lyase